MLNEINVLEVAEKVFDDGILTMTDILFLKDIQEKAKAKHSSTLTVRNQYKMSDYFFLLLRMNCKTQYSRLFIDQD